MKRKVLLFMVALCLITALVASMTACDLTDTLKDIAANSLSNGDDDGDNNSNGNRGRGQ